MYRAPPAYPKEVDYEERAALQTLMVASAIHVHVGQLAKVTTTLNNYAILKNVTFLEVLL